MENILWGIGFTLAAVLLIWLGIRRRRSTQKGYEEDLRRYTGRTTMNIVHVEKSTFETWEDHDGSQELCRQTIYLPTYEYTVDGKTYQYSSRQAVSGMRDLGRKVTGYYDPANPRLVAENKIRKPIFGGGWFFIWAAFLLFFAVNLFLGKVYVS